MKVSPKPIIKMTLALELAQSMTSIKKFALSINYVIGTKNIWLADGDQYGNTYKYTNGALQCALIYKFKKNKLTS